MKLSTFPAGSRSSPAAMAASGSAWRAASRAAAPRSWSRRAIRRRTPPRSRSLPALGAKAAAVETDLTREDACRAMVEATLERFGRLDILVNNAGTNIRKQPEEYTLAEWHRILETNLSSAFMCSQAAYPAMKAAGGGKIIMIGSMMSIFGASFTAPYAATKGGIVQMAKAMACAWGKDNIQVNSVLPGWIDTALTRQGRRDIPGLEERVVARTPAGRWGDAGRFRRHRRVPREPRLRLRHRRRDHGRRRLLGPGLIGRACSAQAGRRLRSAPRPGCSGSRRRLAVHRVGVVARQAAVRAAVAAPCAAGTGSAPGG